MERHLSTTMAPGDQVAAESSLTIRSGEMIAVVAAALALSILVWNHDRVVGWEGAAGVYGAILVGPFVLRWLQARAPTNRSIRFVADFGPILYIIGMYLSLNPVLDAVNMPLADDALIRADERIFGTQLSIWMQHAVPAGVMEVLLISYTTYFFWPAALGLLLWLRRKEVQFDEWVTALMFFFVVNYAFYAIVPAMGPRYFQSAWFDGPVNGLYFAPAIDLMFRDSPLARDCFPSGHTGVSLMVLAFAFREERRFFWVALPVLICLILGTVAGRFHYGIDLIAAVPLTVLSLLVAAALKRRLPEGVTVSRPSTGTSFRRARRPTP